MFTLRPSPVVSTFVDGSVSAGVWTGAAEEAKEERDDEGCLGIGCALISPPLCSASAGMCIKAGLKRVLPSCRGIGMTRRSGTRKQWLLRNAGDEAKRGGERERERCDQMKKAEK